MGQPWLADAGVHPKPPFAVIRMCFILHGEDGELLPHFRSILEGIFDVSVGTVIEMREAAIIKNVCC